MDFVKNVVGPCVGPILGFLVEPVCTNGAYAFQYKNHVQQLEEVNNRLRGKKERIQGMVDTATNKGEVIETEVSNWLEKVEQMEGDITNFLNQPGDGESFRCFQGCMCPNLMWRYKRGMEAEKRNSEVSELISRGALLQTSPVARDASFEPVFDSSQYYTTFQSRASVVDEIRNALKDSGVDIIGVHGPGGAGKTTMVKEVAKEAKELGIFDKIVIAVVSKDPNSSKLQEELASQLDLNSEQISESVRADKLRKALLNGKRKILVILDDLWQVLRLNAIGIPISGLGDRGCKILLTSRNEEVFKKMEVNPLCFPIGYLEEQEAWELFRKVTGDFRVHESTARKVSERCGGLPIAIVAVGAALKGKDEAEWQDALHQLKNCPLKYIEGSEPVDYTPLKWSYDFLKDEDAKSCFLLCCLFPEDAEISIDDLVRYSFALGFLRKVATLKDARNRVQAMVNMLKRSCLLLKGKNKNFVKMHDVIRDLAISITEEKQIAHGGGHDWAGQQQFIVNHDIKEWPKNDAWEHHTAISLRINKDNISFPRGVLHCPLMHTLVFKPSAYNCGYIIPNDFLQGMKEAKVLDFKMVFSEVPSSILELNHLRMLRLNNCDLLGDLFTIQNLKNHIEILSLEGSKIEEVPQEIGNLTRLRSLDLRDCGRLKMIPKDMISNLIHLEELYITPSYKNWDTTTDGRMGYASIGELKSLNQLTVLYVGISTNSYKIMMQECHHLFEKLINFAILINRNLSFDNQPPNVLEIDRIDGTHDEFCLLMDRVEKLRLCNIQGLRYLRGKPQLQFTSSGGGSFCKLIDVRISGCHSMKYLFPPSCPQAFQQLKTLSVYDCRRMEQIIGGVGDYCKSSGGGSFCKLIDLQIYECHSMKYLFPPSCPKALIQQLKTLKVRDCRRMEQIIGGVGDHCNENEVFTEESIIFSRLEMINLLKLPQFRSFCPKMEKTTIEESLSNWTTTTESIFNEKVFFPVLEDLRIDELSVKDIWNKQMIQSPKGSNKVSFSQLKKIEIIQCHNLVNVFPSNMLIQLQNLETLRVQKCLSLTLLVDEDLKPNIQSLTVKFKLTDVFPKLRDLYLDSLPKLMKIWPNDEEYRSDDNYVHLYLRTISIKLCHSLTHAFSAFVARHLASIEKLCVYECLGMEVIVSEGNGGVINDGIIAFGQLKILELQNLPNLKSFSQSKSEASHSFNHQVTFPKIKYVALSDLESSREIQLWDLLATTQEHCVVEISRCQVSTKVLSHHQKQSSRTIVDYLFLDGCWGFKHVIDLNGTISIDEEQFVDVKKFTLYFLPELVLLWNKNLHEIWSLRSLKDISIRNCPQLRSLFMHSMATTLQHLKMLSLRSCEMIEEIIIIEENNINFARKEKATCHILFPKLESLLLDDLPNLKNFCNDERCSFSFSSLRSIQVERCPKMKTFASGQISLPPMMIRAWVEWKEVEITDLNAYFESWNEDNNFMMINCGNDS